MTKKVVRFKRVRLSKDRVTIFPIRPVSDIRQINSDDKLYEIGLRKFKAMQRRLSQPAFNDAKFDKQKKWVSDSLKRLQRLIKLMRYKDEVRALAVSMGFKLPNTPIGLLFLIPVPKSWSKKKKREHHMALISVRPDWDNYAKAFVDAFNIKKKKEPRRTPEGKVMVDENRRFIYDVIQQESQIIGGDDKVINNVLVSKRYVNSEQGAVHVIQMPSEWDAVYVKMLLSEE